MVGLQGQNDTLLAELAALKSGHTQQQDQTRRLSEAHEQLKTEKLHHSDSLKAAHDETQRLHS